MKDKKKKIRKKVKFISVLDFNLIVIQILLYRSFQYFFLKN